MEKKLTLIMPMGGGGTRFGNKGFELPKPLIPIYGKPFFYWATQSIYKFAEIGSLVFVVLQDHIDRFGIDKEILKYYPEAKLQVIPKVLPGAVLTCKAGVELVEEDTPIVFNDCDHLFICKEFCDYVNARKGELDGALLTFKSDEAKFSYVAYDENGKVTHTVEKEVVSNDAICGAYYFKNKQLFLDATEEYLEACSYSEFFMSGLYNVMAKHEKAIGTFGVDVHVSFGTPEEYDAAQSDTTYTDLQ